MPVPRLTDKEYLSRREFLVDAWKLCPAVFIVVSYNQEMELHAYYQPTKQMTNKEAMNHRHQITAQYPNLPNRAGKGVARVEAEALCVMRLQEDEPPQDPTKRIRMPARRGKGYAREVPLAKPEVDVNHLTKAVLDYFESEARREVA